VPPRYLSATQKPWGNEAVWAHTDSYVGKRITIACGHRLSNQYHQFKEETIFIIDGIMRLELQGCEDVFLGPASCYHILIEVSTPHLDDVVRMEDDYGRC